ncbi:hydrolase [Ruania suaedae]|uniref:nitrilase-related carbon-nitrogen hydrolase n=1 Tax=Ruania suaedae TaxID=2897774 RepID=UPI001E4FA5F8|nr:nitrilase-related carbon-nitrogen hydrolase [Ruania suaedae]UFU02327.1 hydrolase [Ruania suaedae]
MSVTVAAVQLNATQDRAENLRLAVDQIRSAARAGAQLVVLPEYASGWAPRLHPGLGEDRSGAFHQGIAAVAAQERVTVVAGTMEPSGQAGRCVNVAFAVGPDGAPCARYEKVHLFDAFGVRESEVLDAGPSGHAVVIEVGDLRVGLATCYDLRFPETFRVLADAGAEVFVVGAAWADGPGKADQLDVLVRARAIENTAYLVLASQGGDGRSGRTQVIDPTGRLLAGTEDASTAAIVHAELDPALVRDVREQVPSLAHRRYTVVPRRD